MQWEGSGSHTPFFCNKDHESDLNMFGHLSCFQPLAYNVFHGGKIVWHFLTILKYLPFHSERVGIFYFLLSFDSASTALWWLTAVVKKPSLTTEGWRQKISFVPFLWHCYFPILFFCIYFIFWYLEWVHWMFFLSTCQLYRMLEEA